MKSYNVKSNAKRAARALAAKYPGYIADEPIPVSEGAREWFPALAAPGSTIASGVPADIRETALVNGGAVADLDPAELAEKRTAAFPSSKVVNVSTPADAEARTMAAAASLPPRKDSTPDEIAARRAERRERIEREKAEGLRDARGEKVKPETPARETKADIILALVGRDQGATFSELMEATGWQRHTLRGYIAGTLRKRGHRIVRTATGNGSGYKLEGGRA